MRLFFTCVTYVLLLFATSAATAQIVTFADSNFKDALVAHTTPVIDTNGDGEIQVTEAEATNQLLVSGKGLADLGGIEAFTNIVTLACADNYISQLDLTSNTNLVDVDARINFLSEIDLSANELLNDLKVNDNFLTNLDLSQNPNLEFLRCNSNFLTSLDLSQNEALVIVSASYNEITNLNLGNKPNLNQLTLRNNSLVSMDLSQCPVLGALSIQFNDLTSLDTTNNPSLRIFRCHGNELNSLDLSSNANLQALYCYLNPLQELNLRNGANASFFVMEANLNPDLNCIQVDDALMANNGEGVYEDWLVDEGVFYAEDCSLGIDDLDLAEILLAPNPVRGNFRITSETQLIRLEIHSALGQHLRTVSTDSRDASVDISNLANGVYFVSIFTEEGEKVYRILKQ